jgi:hypothetical protein
MFLKNLNLRRHLIFINGDSDEDDELPEGVEIWDFYNRKYLVNFEGPALVLFLFINICFFVIFYLQLVGDNVINTVISNIFWKS